jgi:hypothetical protein
VFGVGEQGRRVNASSDPALVERHRLVPDDADDGAEHAPSQMVSGAVGDQLVVALDPCEDGTGPDDEGDTEPRQVLGPFIAVGVTLARLLPRDQEPEQDSSRRRHIREIVDGVTKKSDRVGELRQSELDPTRQRQTYSRPADGPMSRPAVLGVVPPCQDSRKAWRGHPPNATIESSYA